MSKNELIIRVPMLPARNTDSAGPDATVFINYDQTSDGEYSFTSDVDDDINIHIGRDKTKKIANSDYYLVIVGDGPLFKKLKQKAEDENIRDVIFTGSRDDVDKIIPSCDVLVLPSFSESFGLVLIEALSCGKPVIGSNVGGIIEIITDDVGLLVNPNKVSSIAGAIDKIVNDNQFRLELSSNARERAMKFSKVDIPYDEVKQ